MRNKSAIYLRFLLIFSVLGAAGLAATIYVLVNQRVRLPYEDVYTVHARFTAANGVSGGIGQPVNVVGVKVGQVTGVRLVDGVAEVTLEIRRNRLRQVHADATATLSPITPLGDMQIELSPGTDAAPVLRASARIDTERTGVPVPLSDLLSTLDVDTRDHLTGLIAAVDRGTADRPPDLRRLLLRLGPTSRQAGQISEALARRDTQLASFVRNLARVTTAATADGELQRVVTAGQKTLRTIAGQNAALRSSLSQLPATLDAARGTLTRLTPFADQLGPTTRALLPTIRRLPETLDEIGTFSARGAEVLRKPLRPFVRSARPLIRDAAGAVEDLDTSAPPLTGVLQTANYALNELAHVPGGKDQGYLFWMAWFMHNLNSVGTTGDANGAVLRAAAFAGCNSIQDIKQVQAALGQFGICP